MQWPPFKQGLGWHGSEVNARPAEINMDFSKQGCQIVIGPIGYLSIGQFFNAKSLGGQLSESKFHEGQNLGTNCVSF
jgi:hypothetical protein